MLGNMFKDRIRIQVRTTVRSATGETVIWKPVEIRHSRVIPLDAKALAVQQQLKSNITHKVIFRGSVSLSLADNRFLWLDKTLEPVGPAKATGNVTVIMAKEA